MLGDSDTRLGIESVTAGTGVRMVENEVVTTRVGGRRLTLGGIELPYGSPEARRVVRRLETRPGRGDLRLLLTHRPDPVLDLPADTRVDLVVAGHTHGGQLRLPAWARS